MRSVVLFFFVVLGYAGLCGNRLHASARYLWQEGYAAQSDTVSGEPAPDSTSFRTKTKSFYTSLRQMDLRSLDSVIRRLDPLAVFPGLAAMGTVTVPKGYLFLLVGFLAAGGVIIFVADIVQSRKRSVHLRKKRHDPGRGVSAFKMQLAFEAFVVTLFDPMYFHCRRTTPQSVLEGKSAEGKVPADLMFEFDYRDTRARFAVKCLYFSSASKGDVRLFYSERNEALTSGSDTPPLYFVLGFGGTPDDPRELFLLPAEKARRGVVRKETLAPYSKSGMFFYNRAANRLQ